MKSVLFSVIFVQITNFDSISDRCYLLFCLVDSISEFTKNINIFVTDDKANTVWIFYFSNMIYFKIINRNSWKTSIGSQVISSVGTQSHSLALTVEKQLYNFVTD